MKRYLRMTPLTGTGVPSRGVVVGVTMQDQWVTDISKATASDRPAMEVTQQ
jgi:hypothetical protein